MSHVRSPKCLFFFFLFPGTGGSLIQPLVGPCLQLTQVMSPFLENEEQR
jgi:hypothetical protein